MAPIRKGDGTPLEIPGVSEVRSGDGRVFFEGDAIPDSGVFQIDATTLNLSDGDGVTDWKDQIGSNDLSGGTPTYQTSELIDPTVTGDATDDELINTSPSGLPTGDSERTIILVMQSQSAASGETIFAYGNDASGERIAVINDDRNTSGGDLFIEVQGGSVTANSVFSADEKHLITIRMPSGASANDITLRDNGTDLSLDEINDVALNTTLSYVSAFALNGANYSGDSLSEAIIYDSELAGSALTDEEQRLADKWGITLA